MNILITSAGRDVNLVKAFKEALGKEGKGKVICVDTNPFSPAFYFSDLFYLVPKDSDRNFFPELLSICEKNRIKLLIPNRNTELKMFAENKEKFNKIGVTVMVPDVKTVEICFDKLKFVKFCKKNNISTPKTYSIKEIRESKVDFPLFINDRFGEGSKKAFKVCNRKELDCHLANIKKPIIQEYINSKEYTIDLFADFQGNIISVIPRKRIYTFGGESFVGKTYKSKKLIEAAINLSQKLNLIGHNTIQCFFNGQTVKFIEVNPRYGGGANLGFAAGGNTPLYLIQLLKGKKLKKKTGDFKNNLIMLRYTQDIFLERKNLKCKKKQ